MAVDDEGDGTTTMAAMLAEMKNHMTRVQNEMDDNDMRGRTASMQRQMDVMKSKCQTQEDKCKKLEARCGCLERSVKILVKENKWEYSAPRIPITKIAK